jgi:hypothetical protein
LGLLGIQEEENVDYGGETNNIQLFDISGGLPWMLWHDNGVDY